MLNNAKVNGEIEQDESTQKCPTTSDPLDKIMGVNEASALWGLSAGTIKNYCAEGKIKSVKIEGRWILEKYQPNPSQPDHPKNWRKNK